MYPTFDPDAKDNHSYKETNLTELFELLKNDDTISRLSIPIILAK